MFLIRLLRGVQSTIYYNNKQEAHQNATQFSYKVQLYLIPFAPEWMQCNAEWASCLLAASFVIIKWANIEYWEYKSPKVITNNAMVDSLSDCMYLTEWNIWLKNQIKSLILIRIRMYWKKFESM